MTDASKREKLPKDHFAVVAHDSCVQTIDTSGVLNGMMWASVEIESLRPESDGSVSLAGHSYPRRGQWRDYRRDSDRKALLEWERRRWQERARSSGKRGKAGWDLLDHENRLKKGVAATVKARKGFHERVDMLIRIPKERVDRLCLQKLAVIKRVKIFFRVKEYQIRERYHDPDVPPVIGFIRCEVNDIDASVRIPCDRR